MENGLILLPNTYSLFPLVTTSLLDEFPESRFEAGVNPKSFIKVLICLQSFSLNYLDHRAISIGHRQSGIQFDRPRIVGQRTVEIPLLITRGAARVID